MKKIIVPLFLAISVVLQTVAVSAHDHGIAFAQNRGQWHQNVLYKAHVPSGALFLEQTSFTYNFCDASPIAAMHGVRDPDAKWPDYLNGHAFNIKFDGARQDAVLSGEHQVPGISNYYLGNDPSKWASNVHSFGKVVYNSLYNGIDLAIYTDHGELKYDFILAPGARSGKIAMEYNGVDNVELVGERLLITTTINELMEQAPFAYQVINGEQVAVECRFKLRGNTVGFDVGSYNEALPLIIDPQIVFSTFSGSEADNWGFTATKDETGHLYGGGIVFDPGYPISTGAYQSSFNGGSGGYRTDVGITKFTPDGSSIVYSTYLGGSSNELPQSLVVNNQNELLIFGSTSSANFPVTSGAFDTGFNGGPGLFNGNGFIIEMPNGSDIFISKLNPNGTALLASTYVGGTGNDGLNMSSALSYNYGDHHRGEIIVDDNDNVYVASSTSSDNFPFLGGFQGALNGSFDGCVFKLTPNLSTLVWSSYLGGSGHDAGYSVQLDASNNVYVCGGTNSTNFPTTGSTLYPSPPGNEDGFLVKIAAAGNSITASTYIGTTGYDQCYFVQLDNAENVYVYGQTNSTYPISPSSTYGNANSGQFLHKLTNNLGSTVFSTSFGASTGDVEISPTAFLVSECNYIYVSGWGGAVNQSNSQATSSSTYGMPVTTDAFQSSTDGSDFYLAVFKENAESLVYGSFFGGRFSDEHVDGGTSRFDKNGNIYQAVCAGCGGFSDFPTTSDAWSTENGSWNCNLGVFKFDLAELTANILVEEEEYCFPATVDFTNNSNGGDSFLWDFGDGTTSTERDPTHAYADTGTFEVTMTAYDSLTCKKLDVTIGRIVVHPLPEAFFEPALEICEGDSVTLSASGGVEYVWKLGEAPPDPVVLAGLPPWYEVVEGSLPDGNGPNITVAPLQNTTYTVCVTDVHGCTSIATQTVNVKPAPYVDAGPDFDIEWLTGSAELAPVWLKNTFYWHEDSTLSCTDCPNPTADPLESTAYYLTVVGINGCTRTDTVWVFVDGSFYVPNAFTPNGNGVNETFDVVGKEIRNRDLYIYDRWGLLIYESSELGKGWDGKMNGREAQVDVYVWKVLVEEMNGKKHEAVGHVTLVR